MRKVTVIGAGNVGADVVQKSGGRVVLVDLVPGQSTTGMIARMDGAKGR